MYPWGWLAIGAVLLIAAVTLIVVLSSKKKRQTQTPSSDALDTLKLRYSKGELSEEDYLKMKEIIGR